MEKRNLKKPLRVLQFVNVLGSGGIETLIVNYHISIDTNLFQFDYVTHNTSISFCTEKIPDG